MFNLRNLYKLLFSFIKLDLGGGEFSSSIENEQVTPKPSSEKTNEIPTCSSEYLFDINGSIRNALEKLGLGDLYNKHQDIRMAFDEVFMNKNILLTPGDTFKLDITNGKPNSNYNLSIIRKGVVLQTFDLTKAINTKKISIISECKTGLTDLKSELTKQKENNIDSLNLDSNEKEFISTYGGVVSNLSKSFGIDEATVYSLINRESNFEIKAKSHTGSTGYMQLTGSVFNDIDEFGKGRGADRYSTYFKLVPDQIIDQIDGENKDQLISALKRAKNGDMMGFRKLNTRENKNNPIFNLILGIVYLKTLKGDDVIINKKETKRQKEIKNYINILENTSFSSVNKLLVNKGMFVSKEDFDLLKSEILTQFKSEVNIEKSGLQNGNNNDLLRSYNAFKKYNGTSAGNHMYKYAFAIILGEGKWKNILNKIKT